MFQLSVTAVVVAILLISSLPNGGARSIGEKYEELLKALLAQEEQEIPNRKQHPLDHSPLNDHLSLSEARQSQFVPSYLQDRQSLSEAHQSQFVPSYLQDHQSLSEARQSQFTPSEARMMRMERRKERKMMNAIAKTAGKEEIAQTSYSFNKAANSQPMDEQQVNEKNGVAKNYFKGDIVLSYEQKQAIDNAKAHGGQTQAFKSGFRLWDGGVVPYVLDRSLTQQSINAINDAIDEIEEETLGCIDLKERTTETNYVTFYGNKYGCYSYIGKMGWGSQDISIMNADIFGNNCATKGIAMHEIIHALGRFHEQERFDRDNYITVDTTNIQTHRLDQFDIVPESIASPGEALYDFDSIMHYGPYDYAIDPTRPVMTSRTDEAITGQRDHLTLKDIFQIVSAYCPDQLQYFEYVGKK